MTADEMREAIAQRLEAEADALLAAGYYDARINMLTAAYLARRVGEDA